MFAPIGSGTVHFEAVELIVDERPEQRLHARQHRRPSVLAIDVCESLPPMASRSARPVQQKVSRLVELRREHVVQAAVRAAYWPASTLHRPLTSAGMPWFHASSRTMLRLSCRTARRARACASRASRTSFETCPERPNPRVRRNLHLCRPSEHERDVGTCRGILLKVLE